MEKVIFKSNIIYWLEILRIYILGSILGAILIVIKRIDLFFPIFIPLTLIILVFSIRRFFFYGNKIIIVFLFRKITIPFNEIKNVIYDYRAAGGDTPVIILKTTDENNNLFHLLNKYLFYRFILRSINKVAFLLALLKNKHVLIEFKTGNEIKKRILLEMEKAANNFDT